MACSMLHDAHAYRRPVLERVLLGRLKLRRLLQTPLLQSQAAHFLPSCVTCIATRKRAPTPPTTIDPLSISASIAGLLQTAHLLAKGIRALRLVKNAHDDFISLFHEVAMVQATLSRTTWNQWPTKHLHRQVPCWNRSPRRCGASRE
jgi:hypothetical protein